MGKRRNLKRAIDTIGIPGTTAENILQARADPTGADQDLVARINELSPSQLQAVEGGLGGLRSTGIGQELANLFQTQKNIRPTLEAGTGAIPGLERGATLEGFQQNIQDLLPGVISDAQPGIDELLRSNQFGLAATGGLRSGAALTGAADIVSGSILPQVFEAEQSIEDRLLQLFGAGRESALQLGDLGVSSAQRVGAARQGKAAEGLAQAQQNQQTGLQAAGTVASFFSDERLKTDKRKIGKVGLFTIWSWSWNDLANKLFNLRGCSVGVMAQEVVKIQPSAVIRRKDGYLTVKYGELNG